VKSMEKITGTAFDLESLSVFQEYKLLDISEKEEGRELVFTPRTLGRTIAMLACYQALKKIDYSKYDFKVMEKEEEKEKEDKKQENKKDAKKPSAA
ncbi:MAG: hypothetical protein HQK54_12725, partial [Oligoflexales bacterium]|nr:hypothetical protein [Oligoflexales bacterium]